MTWQQQYKHSDWLMGRHVKKEKKSPATYQNTFRGNQVIFILKYWWMKKKMCLQKKRQFSHPERKGRSLSTTACQRLCISVFNAAQLSDWILAALSMMASYWFYFVYIHFNAHHIFPAKWVFPTNFHVSFLGRKKRPHPDVSGCNVVSAQRERGLIYCWWQQLVSK